MWAVSEPGLDERPREKILYPDGGVGIAFNLGDPLSLNGERLSSDLFFDGAWLKASRLSMAGQVDVLGVRFRPGGAYPLLGTFLEDMFRDGEPRDASEFIMFGRLHETLHAAWSTAERTLILQSWLVERLGMTRRCSPLVSRAVRAIERSGGQIKVRDLSRSLDVSPRQLERLFGRQVGMSPKNMARLIRGLRAKEMLKQSGTASFAEVGYRAGYFDQAHFIRDFTSIIGLTPSAYLAARRRWGQRCGGDDYLSVVLADGRSVPSSGHYAVP